MRIYASVYFPCALNTAAEMCLMGTKVCLAVDIVGAEYGGGVMWRALLGMLPHLLEIIWGQVSE